MNSPELLTGFERCERIPYWGIDWKYRKMKPVEMIEAGVRAGLMELTRTDFGELAGEEVYGFGSDPGIESKQYDQHGEVVHLACIADAVTYALRKPGSDPWQLAPSLPDWQSSCYLSPSGGFLRRIVFTTSWNDDKHYQACRSWESLAEVCFHNLPMQLVVVHLGQHRDGKFHSYWSHGLRHPANKKLRFRKKNKVEEPFKESWIEVWREDYDDISTHDWLQGMLQDGVLQDCLKKFDIPVPRPESRQRIIDLAHQKMAIIRSTNELPMQKMSTCDWPTPCIHRAHCHAQEGPSPAYGFVRIWPTPKPQDGPLKIETMLSKMSEAG
jgi:hypothetical protein